MIEFALEKKDAGPYWDRLLKEKNKYHWLKTDFNKWKDEDESDNEEGGQDLEEVSRGFSWDFSDRRGRELTVMKLCISPAHWSDLIF